jgi:hypothetical protein
MLHNDFTAWFKVCHIHFRLHHMMKSVTMLQQAHIVYCSCILNIIIILNIYVEAVSYIKVIEKINIHFISLNW